MTRRTPTHERRSIGNRLQPGQGSSVNLATSQSGTGPSQNVAARRNDRNQRPGPAAGRDQRATSISWTIEGSPDGTNFYPLPYVDVSSAGAQPAPTSAALTATADTKNLALLADWAWSYLRLNIGANTGTTITSADLVIY
jgi:hypothetical protein